MSPRKVSEFTRLTELSGQLEELPFSSNAYNALLQDNILVKQTTVVCEDMTLQTTELPPDMVEAHYFPSRFILTDFKAQLSELPKEDRKSTELSPVANDTEWSFRAKYKINNNQYRLLSNVRGTVLTTENYDGTELSFTFKADMAVQFLAGIALGALRNGESFDPRSCDLSNEDYSAQIAHFLYLIGTSNGQYDLEQSSFMFEPEQSRSLLVTQSERENKTGSVKDYRYRLIFKIGETMLGDSSSEHHAKTVYDSVYITHFAERQPGYTEPEDLPYESLLLDQPDTSSVLFEPSADTVGYMRINAAIMEFIRQLIRSRGYRSLDLQSSIEEIIDDEDLLEKYFYELPE